MESDYSLPLETPEIKGEMRNFGRSLRKLFNNDNDQIDEGESIPLQDEPFSGPSTVVVAGGGTSVAASEVTTPGTIGWFLLSWFSHLCSIICFCVGGPGGGWFTFFCL